MPLRPPAAGCAVRRGAARGPRAAAPRRFRSDGGVSPFASALRMAAAIREGETTSRALVELHIDRIERLDARVNAVVARDFVGARARADEADRAVRDGRARGPFHGVPVTIKEAIPTPGYRTSNGFRWPKLPATTSCVPAARLIGVGGAVLLGKSNLAIGQADWETNNPVYGRTGNPWDTTRSPGGSSGGAAAALAAGLTPLELGTDLAGSVRLPSALCGVVGHCATFGVVPDITPAFGHAWLDRRLAQFAAGANRMARTGPMARTAEDVTAMLEVLGGDAAAHLPRPSARALGDCRVGVWRSHAAYPPNRQVRAALEQVVAALEGAGATVEEVEPPVDPLETYRTYLRGLGAFGKAFGMPMPMRQKVRALLGRARDSYPAAMPSPMSEFDTVLVRGPGAEHAAAVADATGTWDDYLRRYDAVVCPIFPCEAWPGASEPYDMLTAAAVSGRALIVDGESRFYGDGFFWPHVQVLGGFPATGFPVHLSPEGLPVGLQAFGCRDSDFVVLDVVRRLMHELHEGGRFPSPPDF